MAQKTFTVTLAAPADYQGPAQAGIWFSLRKANDDIIDQKPVPLGNPTQATFDMPDVACDLQMWTTAVDANNSIIPGTVTAKTPFTYTPNLVRVPTGVTIS